MGERGSRLAEGKNTEFRNRVEERIPQHSAINPLMRLDYPDPDVIRVEDTY